MSKARLKKRTKPQKLNRAKKIEAPTSFASLTWIENDRIAFDRRRRRRRFLPTNRTPPGRKKCKLNQKKASNVLGPNPGFQKSRFFFRQKNQLWLFEGVIKNFNRL